MSLNKSTYFLSRKQSFAVVSSRALHWFQDVPMGPPDAILGVTEAFKACQDPKKVNVGVGAYRDDAGKPFVLSCVKEAEKRILSRDMDHEYFPIAGSDHFGQLAAGLAFGDKSKAIAENLNATVQSLSGTGALRLATAFLAKFFPGDKTLWMPTPTWGNHNPIARHAGLEVRRYRYYNPENCALDTAGFFEDVNKMPPNSIVLLHACAHNPTGVDPTKDQWRELSALIRKKKLFPFFDMAYQGFATGDVTNDAYAVRHFADEGHEMILCQSFAKNMGLYGERIGGFHVICKDKDSAAKVLSQIKIIIRPMYSNPPIHGARIVTEVLGDPQLKSTWLKEVKLMADRIIGMRKALKDNLIKEGSKKNWNHITDQIGMFCYTGMTTTQVEHLKKEFFIFGTSDGRISIPALTSGNVGYVAKAIHAVTKDS